MHESRPAAPLGAALSFVPFPVLARLTIRLRRTMRRRHPNLLEAFNRLDPAVVHVMPTDTRHRFAITFGGGRDIDIRALREADDTQADATVRGSLTALIDLLEGRIDGDAVFFSRDIQVGGSSAVVVAVRNTLDREEIVLRDELAALFGPLERPARRLGRRAEAIAAGIHAQIATMHARLHAAEASGRHLGSEIDALRAEVAELRTRLAKLDVRQQRHAAAVGVTP